MASTPSPSLRLELMATGDQSGTWGDTTNVNLGTLLEQAITGYLSIAKTDATDYTLTNTDYAINETRNAVIEFTGSPGNVFNVITPAAEKTWLFKNSTNQTMTVKVSGQTGVAVPAGTAKLLYCDGTDVEEGLAIPTTYFTSTSTALSPTGNDAQALGTTALQWGDLYLASAGVVNFNNGDVTITHSANGLAFAGADNGYTFSNTVLPSANDGAALGASGTAFSDLFLASGGVINFDAGDVTITHSANTLAFAGATSYTFNGGTAYFAGGTDVALADGGTGASLTDPGADRIMFWDDSAGAVTWLTAGSGLSITDTTLSVTASSPFTGIARGAASNTQTFNATGTWTKPNTGNYAVVYAWGGGGAGTTAEANRGGGGGGGAFIAEIFSLSSLGATETVTIAAGRPSGGGNQVNATNLARSLFGNVVVAYGGGRGAAGSSDARAVGGGGGGGTASGGSASFSGNVASIGVGGSFDVSSFQSFTDPVASNSNFPTLSSVVFGFSQVVTAVSGDGGDGASALDALANSTAAQNAIYGGAGGGAGGDVITYINGGNAVWGGGGGGGKGTNAQLGVGGSSTYGGRGGNATISNMAAANGVQPGGGSGAHANNNLNTKGGDGKVIVYVYD